MSGAGWWTPDKAKAALDAIRGAPQGAVAARLASAAVGREVSPRALSQAMGRAKARGWIGETVADVTIRSHSVSALEYVPAVARPRVGGGESIAPTIDPPDEPIIPEDIAPPRPGETSVFGLWADLHIGSDDCAYRAIREFQRIGAHYGVKNYLLAGDWCDGSYTKRGGQHEQTHVGLDSQVCATLDLLDQRPGVRHWIIDGNHEHTFYCGSGVRPGELLESSAIANGRSDIRFLGYPKAQITLRGILFELVHYRRGVRRAPLSHFLSRQDHTIPDVLVGGHYHIYDVAHVRGALCIQPGAFQRETDFMAGSEFHPLGGVLLHVHHGELGNTFWTTFIDLEHVR